MGGGGKGGGGGGGSSMPSTMTQTTKWSPPDYLGGNFGGLNSYMSYAAQVLGKPYNQYTGQTQASPSTDTQMGWQIARQRALNGNQLGQYSDNVFKNTMSGAYMNPASNPYLQGALNYTQADTARNYNQAIAPQLNNAFARSRAFGGSAYNQQLGESQRQLAGELGRNASNAYLGNYNNERNNQMNLMNYADQAGNRDYNDAQQLMNLGQQQGGYLQNYLTQGQQDHTQANNFLTDNMGKFQNVIGGLTGQGNSATTSTNPNVGGTNKLASGLGGAMSGYSLGGLVGQSPIGQSMISAIPGLTYSQMPWFGAGIGALGGLLK